jgi:hypothetical protein
MARATTLSGSTGGEDDMRKMMRHVLGAAGLAVIVTTSVVWAQEAQPVRVRGEIAKVEGNTLSIKSRDGQNLTVKLADNDRGHGQGIPRRY